MEDIFKNFDENLEKMSSVLDEIERADIIADNIFFHLNRVLKNSRDGNAYSKWNKLFSVPENAKMIQKSNLETLVTKSKELIDTVSHNTVIFAHGDLDISTFITVPKNTIILTFVEETRVLLDSGGLNKDIPSQADIFIFLWVKYLSKLLDYSNKYINPSNTEVLYILIKKFIIKFIDIKNKYMNEKSLFPYNSSQKNLYRKYGDDFVAYYENDLIPNQILNFTGIDTSFTDIDTSFTGFDNIGIIPWDKYLDLSLSTERNKDVIHDYSDESHPFYKIYESLNKKYTDIVSNSTFCDLVRVLSEMKMRLDKSKNGKINIIILKSCRKLDDLILKPQHSYLFKNLPAVLQERKKKYKYNSPNKIFINQIKKKVMKIKGRTEDERNRILSLATNEAKKLTTDVNEQKSYVQKIQNKMNSRIFGLAQEYDIFYEKLCIHIEKHQDNLSQLYYYDDAKLIDSYLPKKKKGLLVNKKKKNLMSNEILGEENYNYNENEYELNYFETLIPVRNIWGVFENVLECVASPTNPIENLTNLFSSSTFNFSPILIINKLKEKMFWIDKNQNTELYYELYTTFRNLNFEPYEKFDILKDIRYREHIFKEWEDNFKKKTHENTVRDIYIAIMKDCFVSMARLSGKKYTLKDLKYTYGIKKYLLNRKRKRNQPILSVEEKERLKKILRVFSWRGRFQLFYCNTFFIENLLFNPFYELLEENIASAFDSRNQIILCANKDVTYLTPIEYCLANYAVLDGKILSFDRKIWSLSESLSESLSDSQLVSSNSNFPDLQNPEIRHKLGLYSFFNLTNTTINLKYFCDLVNARNNLTEKEILQQSLKDYMESFYRIFVRNNLINGIQEFQSETLNITNITLFPGNFVFMLDYIQQKL